MTYRLLSTVQAILVQSMPPRFHAVVLGGVDLAELDEISELHLLSVKLDRLTTWHRPGLLAIGDAAHAMSPVGGIGINLAVQDAVAAANALAGPLARGENVDPLLRKVQEQRLFPTRIIQSAQKSRSGARDRACAPVDRADPGSAAHRAPAGPLPVAPPRSRPTHRPRDQARAGSLS